MKILVTGAAGFIGYCTARALLERGDQVSGIDNLSPYYDVGLKKARLAQLAQFGKFDFVEGDVADAYAVEMLFAEHRPERVIHLAAQAGVRYSLSDPSAYIRSNLVGFANILEASRHNNIDHLVFASSSSVYGANTKVPFSVHDNADHPISLYGATKKSNELMAHTYAHLFQLPMTGLRFFTVYGPWGRPDMALFKFVKNILADEPIDIFNNGNHARAFTYTEDVVEAVLRVSDRPPAPDANWSSDHPDPACSSAPYRLYNIGGRSPVQLLDLIALIEAILGRRAKKNFLPMQPGDVPATPANVSDLAEDFDWAPTTPIEVGVAKFIDWYQDYLGLEVSQSGDLAN